MNEFPPRVAPELRRRLQATFEAAQSLARTANADLRTVQARFAACVAADPGNHVYVAALLDTLARRSPPTAWTRWWNSWTTPANRALKAPEKPETPDWPKQVRDALATLDRLGFDAAALEQLALAAAAADAPETEQLIRQALATTKPKAPVSEPAAPSLRATNPATVDEAIALAEQLVAEARFADAEGLLTHATATFGGDLRVREAWEDALVAQAINQVQSASARGASAEELAALEQERRRIELQTLDARARRYPTRIDLTLEGIERVRAWGLHEDSLRRIADLRRDERFSATIEPSVRARLFLWEGESWQALRVFARATTAYAAGLLEPGASEEDRCGLLYRAAVLKTAQGEAIAAKACFSELLQIRPDYKDARGRLDKLP